MNEVPGWLAALAAIVTLAGLGVGIELLRRRYRRGEADRAASVLGAWFAEHEGADAAAVAAWYVAAWRGGVAAPPVPLAALEYHALRLGSGAVQVRIVFLVGDHQRARRVTLEEQMAWHELPEPVRESLIRGGEGEVTLRLWPVQRGG